jgi:mono/diheme cytochrome c family protein
MLIKYLVFVIGLCSSFTALPDSISPNLGIDASTLSLKKEWNLTITPNGHGLPKGSGDAYKGAQIYALKCSSCHGPEAIGGSADPLVGEVGSLKSPYPEKTIKSYWPYATTLFDYIRRAMPIDAPFSLTPDEIYSLCAYILNKDDVILKDVELNEETLPRVTMPNRSGFVAIYPDTN